MEKRYFIQTYGCQMNLHESEKLAGMLENMGYVEVFAPEDANLIIYVTCCIRENAEQKVYGHLGALKPYKMKNPDVIVAATNGRGGKTSQGISFCGYYFWNSQFM